MKGGLCAFLTNRLRSKGWEVGYHGIGEFKCTISWLTYSRKNNTFASHEFLLWKYAWLPSYDFPHLPILFFSRASSNSFALYRSWAWVFLAVSLDRICSHHCCLLSPSPQCSSHEQGAQQSWQSFALHLISISQKHFLTFQFRRVL